MASDTLVDPLARLLPPTDPLAAFDLQRAAAAAAEQPLSEPPNDPRLPSAQPTPTTPAQASTAAQLAAAEIAVVTQAKPEPRVIRAGDQTSTRPRRAVPWTRVVLAALLLAMLGGIAACAYLLSQRESFAARDDLASDFPPAQVDAAGRAASLSRDRDLRAAGEAVGSGPFAQGLGPALAAAEAADASRDPSLDPSPSDPERTVPSASEPIEVDRPMPADAVGAVPAETTAAEPVTPIGSLAPAEVIQPEQPVAAGATDPQPPTTEQQARGEQAYQAARQALRTQDWPQIKPLAERARELAAGEKQVERASQLYQLADLADYYHGGLVRALEGLEAGATFDLAEDLKVVVVEADATMLQIRYYGRNKSYPFDEIPLVLVHMIGRSTMDADSPTTVAAKAAFHSVCRLATPADRQLAVQWLSQIDGDIEGATADALRAAIEQLDAA